MALLIYALYPGVVTEVWFRNPLTYIRECAELLTPNIAWDRGLLRKNRVDAQKHLELHMPSAVPYRILLFGDQGTAELRRGHGIQNPYAVYPTWEYGVQQISELEALLAQQHHPVGPTPDECGVPGQEHRVCIIKSPPSHHAAGKAFIRTLSELQEDYPYAIVHYHGSYSFRVAFGNGFGAADVEPVGTSAKGKIMLGSGREILWEEAPKYSPWIALGGFKPSELSVARNRTMFIMRSAIWASTNFNVDSKFLIRPDDKPIDHMSPVPVQMQTNSGHTYAATRKPQPGDKFLCDQCSLAPTCRYQRDKGVCTIPDSEPSSLAKKFKTRDSEKIIDGLGELMAQKVSRAERAMQKETQSGENDPEVTRQLKIIFDSGVKLAKLVNPSLAGTTKVGVFINGTNTGAIGTGEVNNQALMATAFAELEASGIDRADIDAEMVAQYLTNKHRGAIEATARE